MCQLPPAETCVQCNRPLVEVGGKRISSTSARGLGIRRADDSSLERLTGGPRDATRLEVVIDEQPYVAFYWGSSWSERMLEHVRAELAAGRRPWFCQLCAGRTCSQCDHILRVAQGADILHEDGQVRHQMIAAAARLCTNPACDRYNGPAP